MAAPCGGWEAAFLEDEKLNLSQNIGVAEASIGTKAA
jgi:hypothetical protein